MNKQAAKVMTVGELENSKTSSVWVKNSSNPKGNVNLTMNDGQGQQLVVQVPVTWIAVDLTTQATKSAILSSPAFRRMLAQGLIQLVAEEDALAMMAGADAQKEAQRIYNRAQDLNVDAQHMPQEAQKAQTESDGSISGFAMNIAASNDMDEDQVMQTLRNNESNLTEEDLKYIAQNSSFARVKTFAAERLTK